MSAQKTSTKRKIQPLYTIGYEQAKPASVLGELKRARVQMLVDTRAVAASRRPGFSKRQLAAALDEAQIAYIHLQKLGTPAEGRTLARHPRLWWYGARRPRCSSLSPGCGAARRS